MVGIDIAGDGEDAKVVGDGNSGCDRLEFGAKLTTTTAIGGQAGPVNVSVDRVLELRSAEIALGK